MFSHRFERKDNNRQNSQDQPNIYFTKQSGEFLKTGPKMKDVLH